MKLAAKVHFDEKPLLDSLNNRFGLGSKAQKEWGMTVFDGSLPYTPEDTGDFIQRSRAATEKTAAQGEIVYAGPQAKYLWHGEVMESPTTGSAWAEKGETKVIRQPIQDIVFKNPLAGPRWVETAKANHLDAWIADYQEKIRNGEV